MHGPDGNFFGDSGYGRTKDGNLPDVFRCVHTSLYEGLSVRPWLVRGRSRIFFKPRNLIGNGQESLKK